MQPQPQPPDPQASMQALKAVTDLNQVIPALQHIAEHQPNALMPTLIQMGPIAIVNLVAEAQEKATGQPNPWKTILGHDRAAAAAPPTAVS